MSKEVYPPNSDFATSACIKSMDEYWDLQNRAKEDYEGFWKDYANDKIEWISPYDKVLDESSAPFYRWFVNGKLNVCNQCVDRHLTDKANKTAILFEGDRGDVEHITYAELSLRVNRMANLLREKFGIQKGDRVILYMPMIPEAAYAMLACARIGAIHSIVFGGFSAEALKDRIEDAQAKLIITADGAYRKGKPYMLKQVVDAALSEGGEGVKAVLVVKRNNEPIEWVEGRDYCYNSLIDEQHTECPYEIMDSEDPLFLLYTSGSTGKPKGVQHSSAGYILWAQMTMEWVFDIKDEDVYWCTADIGWITGHTYIIYGPLSAGVTTVMFEGVPTYPNAGRAWKMVQDHKISQFYTAPTAIRVLHKMGEDEPKKYNLSSLKVLGTVGEPIDPPAWRWYYEVVGNAKCAIVDTWWQTETGGHMISPLPGATPIKPACATFPLPGIMAEVIDEDGTPKEVGETGLLCITKPWPSMIRTIWGDSERYKKSYFGDAVKDGKPVYFSGDGAVLDKDGYITITGRVDDVINVSGHRMGTAEIEAAVKDDSSIAEVAVVGRPHDIKGESIFIYVVLKEGYTSQDIKNHINQLLAEEIGNIAKADHVVEVPGLPKTRSGKIMRRILRSIAKGEEITQDISTLEDPKIVEKIISKAREI
ncbi:MAG: acetate--CoA ligase [Sulfurovum sp.]|nr:acetate--CoA ligase [Sulfurovum sp.]MCB4746735.1 acetate--CoA ligase [Sulfurovum sp.]MCB4751064.1 acetate--CoA ligase [Sulfurovum sp.]MCB4759760.1 acetate--CoA ligase [Sulfurovum sp.]MCB4762510.1 acetate--CoA ligase [Sulfurovum sp.]